MRTPHNLNPRQKQTIIEVLSTPERKRLELALKRETSKKNSLAKELGKMESEHKRLKMQYHTTLDELRTKKVENTELLEQLERANKQLAWFKKQYFGQKTEANLPLNVDHDDVADDDSGEEKNSQVDAQPRKRGQQPGSKGHGRTDRSNLPQDDPEIIDLAEKCCPNCHKEYAEISGTDDSSLAEIESQIVIRVIKRKKYAARCKCAPARIVTAPPIPKLYPKTAIGNSIWVHLVVQKCCSECLPIAF
jgi:hypothetical protein